MLNASLWRVWSGCVEGSVKHRLSVSRGKDVGKPIRACSADMAGEDKKTGCFLS